MFYDAKNEACVALASQENGKCDLSTNNQLTTQGNFEVSSCKMHM